MIVGGVGLTTGTLGVVVEGVGCVVSSHLVSSLSGQNGRL